jgi:DNA ligase-1
MAKGFKPLLAYTVKDMKKLEFPVLASPKLDGIRCLICNDQPVSRALKPIPNSYIQDELAFYPEFDGELLVGDPTDPSAFSKSTSGIMSHGGRPDFTFWVFDWIDPKTLHLPFVSRLEIAENALRVSPEKYYRAKIVPHTPIDSPEGLVELEAHYVALGYEGIMVRDPSGVYKFGRSTVNQQLLGKVKRFDDTEGVIIGFEELMHNENEAERNELGYLERSHAQAGQIPGNTLGALKVSHPDWQETFGIGTGFTADERFTLWQNRSTLKGQTVKFKHQPSGAKDKPRFPVYLGLRKD